LVIGVGYYPWYIEKNRFQFLNCHNENMNYEMLNMK